MWGVGGEGDRGRVGLRTIVRLLPVVALLSGGAAAPATAQGVAAGSRGESVRIEADHGTVAGYAAGPEDARAAVLFVHDWFGVSEATRKSVESLGALGYRALAVDLYHGESATTHPEANALMNDLDQEVVGKDLEAAVGYLARGGRPLASVGFSMGANIALRAAYLAPEAVRATINVYGGGAENQVARHDGALPGPFLFITGSDDGWPMTTLQALMAEAGGPDDLLEVYLYPGARHGYAQPLYAGGDNLDPEATRATRMVIGDFLARHLPALVNGARGSAH